jgi:hypothetical protein
MTEVREVPRRGAIFWLSAAAGWALILWGVRGALHHDIDTRPGQLVRFLLGGALVHDLVLAPMVLLVGVLIARRVRGRWRAPVQSALFISATLTLFAYPLLRGYGRVWRNPTSLPHNYAANLIVLVAAVAVGTAVVALVSANRRRDGGAPAPGRRPGRPSSDPASSPTGLPRSRHWPRGRARSS